MHLWQTVPHLKQGSRVSSSSFVTWPDHDERTYEVETIADQHRKWGYRFVPLVTEYLNLLCGLDILFLRPEDPGKLVQGGDIDNRLKTLFDALRMPHEQSELGGYDSPSDGEDPFFCLLRDDSLISNVSVDTDSLLEPVQESKYQANDARLVITVKIRPQQLDIDNIQFA
jgi:hypothetical protein